MIRKRQMLTDALRYSTNFELRGDSFLTKGRLLTTKKEHSWGGKNLLPDGTSCLKLTKSSRTSRGLDKVVLPQSGLCKGKSSRCQSLRLRLHFPSGNRFSTLPCLWDWESINCTLNHIITAWCSYTLQYMCACIRICVSEHTYTQRNVTISISCGSLI